MSTMEDVAMASDFTGSNSDKIDKLVATVVELRTTLRIFFAVIGIGFLLMVSLLVFLTLQSFSISSKFDRMSYQLYRMRSEFDQLKGRLNEIEKPRRP